MQIQGHLAEFSLAELYSLLRQGKQTGVLALANYQIGFWEGQIVGASLPEWDWRRAVVTQGWLRPETLERLSHLYQRQEMKQPFGRWLVEQGLLQRSQIRWLFSQQVLRPVCRLFALPDAPFQLRPQTQLSHLLLTGLRAEPLEVILAGLRLLKDWQHLLDKLPDPDSGLKSCGGQPGYHLNRWEWRLWEYSNGQMSLGEIAEKWQVPVLEVQKLAFRLLTVGLVVELPYIHLQRKPELSASQTPVTEGFLDQLLGFLQGSLP